MKILLLVVMCCLSLNAFSAGLCSHLGWRDSETPSHIQVERNKFDTAESLINKAKIKAEAVNENSYQPLVGQKLKAEYLEDFQSSILFSEHGRIPEGAKYRMAAFHGAAAKYSRAEAMIKAIRYFGDAATKAKSGSATKKLRNHEDYVLGAVEAIDQIAHGTGPRAKDYMGLEKSVDYNIQYLQSLKDQTPDLPLIVYARSTSGVLMEAINRKAPHLIDAFVIMSSPVPMNTIVLEAREGLLQKEKEGKIQLNREGLAWAEQLMFDTTWKAEEIFGNKPTLILTGSRDHIKHGGEMAEAEYQFYRDAGKRPNIKYINIKNATHDVLKEVTKDENGEKLAPEDRYSTAMVLETLKMIMSFNKEVVDQHSN